MQYVIKSTRRAGSTHGNYIATAKLKPPLNGHIQTAEVIVGPSATDSIVITATGIDTWDGAFVQLTAKTAVRNVFLQARQSKDINQDNGWADQFVLQFISWKNAGTNNLQITFRITRLDILYESSPPPDVGTAVPRSF
jgi:hypothetical protein